jgi:ABC-type amino acid transport substrate-binding protein
MSNLDKFIVNRRQALGLGAGAAAMLGLAACSDSSSTDEAGSAAGSDAETAEVVELDTAAYDELIAGAIVADDDVIEASEWAKAVKDADVMRVGGVETSTLFSLMDEEDGFCRGFDAGLSQLLAHYILGDETKIDQTQVTSDTRESLLQNDQVDAVFATYSINDERKEVISFAGPYYTTKQGILVNADNTDINGVDDLAGKTVAVQSGSTGPEIVEEYAPEATQEEFKTDEEARAALEQGRVDAYVIDASMQMSTMVKNPGKYRLAGEEFGPEDNYGIGLPKDSDGVDFVNAWLQELEDDGTWASLWQICIGDRIDSDEAPEPPTIGA